MNRIKKVLSLLLCVVMIGCMFNVQNVQAASYGKVSGNITYFYNNYWGNRGDTGAKVLLVPTNGKARKYNFDLYTNSNELKKRGVYLATVDGRGEYVLNHIPTGTYKVLIISNKTTTGAWFKAFKDSISDAPTSYYDRIAKKFYPKCLNKKTALKIMKWSVGPNKYTTATIKVYKNETTTLSYDFGMTYI